MAYHINEELGDIYYEVIGDQLILKIRDGILGRGCDIYIIKSDDATVPSDDTVFSSKRTLEEIERRAGEGDGYWEMKEDSSGNKYIYTKYPMVSQYGATFYAGTPIEVGSIYEGLPIDNDTIYWSEVDGVKILKSKGGEGGDLNADKLWKLLGAATSEQINYAHLTNAFDAFIDVYKNSFVTIGEPEQDISVIKNFIGGVSIGENKHKLYEKDGVVYFDGDLAVTGGITQYALGDRVVSTIMDGVVVDGITISKEGGALKIIGGTGGSDLDVKQMWAALAANTTEQINKSHLTTALSEYATTDSVSTLQTEITKKWTQDDAKIKNWDTAFGWGNHAEAGYAHLANEEIFTGLKHFSVGLTVGAGKHKLYEKDGVVYFDGDLAVTGGITQYALGDTPVSTIMDGVATDNVTIKKENGKLVVIGGGGSSFDSAEMWKLLEADTTEQINRSHLTTALQGYATESWANSNFPTKTGTGASGTWGININGTAKYVIGDRNQNIAISGSADASEYDGGAGFSQWAFGVSRDISKGYISVLKPSTNVLGLLPYGTIVAAGNDDTHMFIGVNYENSVFRIGAGNADKIVWQKTVAFTDSNVASATKLQTPRTLWGRSFDGTENISGDIDNTRRIYSQSGTYLDLYGNTGIAFYTAGVLRAVVMSNGNVGVGTSSPSNTFHVNGTTRLGGDVFFKNDGFKFDQYGNVVATVNNESYHWGVQRYGDIVSFCVKALSGNVGINIDSPTEKLHVNGNILSTGGITQYSDQRAKTIIEQITLSLQSIADAPAIRFKWNGWKQKDDGKTHIGGIAQYIQKILPEAIYNTDGVLTMDYATTGYIFAVQTARHLLKYETKTEKEINRLKQRVKYLEKQLKKRGYEETGTLAN